MNRELGIGPQKYGLLTGIFFIGYFLFEVPSNVLLHKLGARVWMARILVSWGIVAVCTGFVRSAAHLYTVRFLLGLAEAGFFPGMILYLTYWFRSEERAQVIALFMVALPLSSIIGGPVSGLILDHIRWLGLASWRWLLLLEGIPAVVLGVVTYYVLPSRPADARFLTEKEKDWLAGELRREEQTTLRQTGDLSALKALGNGRVWYLAAISFGAMIGLNCMSYYLPSLVKGVFQSYSNTAIGLLVSIPHLCGLIAMVLISRHSDCTQERRYHAAVPPIVAGIALLCFGKNTAPVFSIVLLSFVMMGIDSYLGPFWSLPSKFLTGFGAAAGIAMINSVGNLGGFVGPSFVGAATQRTGSVYRGLAFVGMALLASAFLVLCLKEKPQAMLVASVRPAPLDLAP